MADCFSRGIRELYWRMVDAWLSSDESGFCKAQGRSCWTRRAGLGTSASRGHFGFGTGPFELSDDDALSHEVGDKLHIAQIRQCLTITLMDIRQVAC